MIPPSAAYTDNSGEKDYLREHGSGVIKLKGENCCVTDNLNLQMWELAGFLLEGLYSNVLDDHTALLFYLKQPCNMIFSRLNTESLSFWAPCKQ